MNSWNDFKRALKSKMDTLLDKGEINESSLQFEKIVADTLKDMIINEGTMSRKKVQSKHILYRDNSIRRGD